MSTEIQSGTQEAASPAASAKNITRQEILSALSGKSTQDLLDNPAGDSVTPSAAEHAAAAPAAQETAASGEATGREQLRPEVLELTDKSGREARSDDRALRSWEEVNAAKQRLAEDQAKLIQERAALERERAQAAVKGNAWDQEIANYQAAIPAWDKQGRDDLVEAATKRIGELRQEKAQAGQRARMAELKEAQHKELIALLKENPHLGNLEHEQTKALDAFLRAKPAFLSYPEGLRDAYAIVSSQQVKGKVGTVEKELAATKQRLTERERLLQPATGLPPAASGSEDTTFESLPSSTRKERILAALRGVERQGGNLLS